MELVEEYNEINEMYIKNTDLHGELGQQFEIEFRENVRSKE